MFGLAQKSGPEAVSLGNTLYRIAEISWIKVSGLNIVEKVVKFLSLVLALWLVMALGKAKGSYFNVECLLALLPLHLSFLVSGQLRLASTADFEESYDGRVAYNTRLFKSWVEDLCKKNEGWLRLSDGDYEYAINPAKVAWARPRLLISYYPIFIAIVLYAYLRVVQTGWSPKDPVDIVRDLHFMTFDGGRSQVIWALYLVIVTCVVAFVGRVKRGVELCAPGGAQDTFWLTQNDQELLLEVIAGNRSAGATPSKAAPKPAAAKPPARPPAAKPPAPAASKPPAPPKTAPKVEAKPKVEKPEPAATPEG